MTSHQFLSMDNASSSSSKLPQKYDVLINCTGEDIRRKFVSHLDSALSTAGLTTFLHHQNATKPTHIQQPILNLCRVVIVVFTKTYSESAWCLLQLQQIIKWHETYSRYVLPVYYEIQPSDVRLQEGDFGKAFKATAHQTFSAQQLDHGMSSWSHALTKAANFFGYDESNYRSDAEVVDKIVKNILNLSVLSATKFPIGLPSHVEDLIQTIKCKSAEVCTIGICGEVGYGKTTLAKAIYNQIHGIFAEKSFIENISQVIQTRGYAKLQEKLLSDVLNTKVEIQDVDMGRRMIQDKFYGKRLLIVLDDMNESGPFLELCTYRARFSGGTVIIITTTDERILRTYAVDSVFQIKLMNEKESLELLSWHAFSEAKPKEEYNDLAERVVSYCGGLPLALELIGSTLFERTKEEWNSVLFKFEKIPQHHVVHKLKISFDGLKNQIEKDLFLDVCCFFVGKDRSSATKILNGSGVDADSGIRVLIERNLIKVKKNNKIEMHPLLQEMGIRIIREISIMEPWKTNQLWFDKDAEYALIENKGKNAMKWLPLKLDQVKIAVNSEYLLQKLRWISLHGFPSEYVHNKYCVHDAITIDLKHSLVRFVWKAPQVLRSLKVLNLSHSKYLTITPDFTGLPNLEQLILKYCPRLYIVHRSIRCLCNLILLNLKNCKSLTNFPTEIYELKSLRTLILTGCSEIDLMGNDIAQMESLITLIAENTAVKEVPFSMVSSKSIGYISLRGMERLSRNLFPSIICSWMLPTVNRTSYIHSFFMDTKDNSWDDIAPLLSTLRNLRSVLVQCDSEFQLSKQVKNILSEDFANITESEISKFHTVSSLIGVGRYNAFFNSVNYSISEVMTSSDSCEVFYCLAHIGEGHSVSFSVPQDRDMKGMAFRVVYLSTHEIIEPEFTTPLIVNYTKCTFHIHNHGTVISFNDEDWHGIVSNLRCGDKVEIFVSFGNGLVVNNTVFYLICGESHNFRKRL